MGTRNRTWLCCVAFLDVVGFSKHHLQAQIAIKSHLDAQVRQLLAKYTDNDYILLDRGDGAAVCFLVEPEAALYFSLDLRDAVRAQENSPVSYEVRIGINLGPVRIVRDVKGEETTLGEGINCAARVMDFAGAGQILVSRSFYEVIGCLSQEYSELFLYKGKKADKHVREFDIYEVAPASTDPATPADVQDSSVPTSTHVDWAPEALRHRVERLSPEIGPMAEILVQRAARRAGSLEELDQILAAPDIRVSRAASEDAVPVSEFDPELLTRAEQLLSDYLGPIAAVLVRDAAARTSDPAGLGRMLADELADEVEQQAFLAAFGAGR